MIAALYNIPTDRPTLMRFSFHNADSHLQAIQRVYQMSKVVLPSYPIDPMPTWDLNNWAYTHQAMHNSVNETLGLTGNDLTSLDPSKVDQLTYWIQLHAAEHAGWANVLGFG